MDEVSDPLRALVDVFKPDERQENLVYGLQDVHEMLSAMTLREEVPVGVRQLFETAKNVRLYTYFVYRFHQVAEMAAYQSLEMALLMRWRQDYPVSEADEGKRLPALSQLLLHAATHGWISNEGFSGRFWRAARAIAAERSEAAIRATMAGHSTTSFSAPTEDEIQERAARIDVVSVLVRSIPKMRNDLAHGSTKLMPSSDYVLQDVRDAINQLFGTAR